MKLNHERVLSSKKCPAYIFEWFYNHQNSQAFPKASWKRVKVHGSKSAIFFSAWFCSTINECLSKRASPQTLSMSITWTEIILAIYSHTSLLSITAGCHFLSLYACACIVSFPNHRLLRMRLAPTFELRHYDAKDKACRCKYEGLGMGYSG